ncbi:MAG: VWA domain-containing protein [Planctomycetes bacterium]|nr:VWA domain-containing protein [Planctomycetota bacterium]
MTLVGFELLRPNALAWLVAAAAVAIVGVYGLARRARDRRRLAVPKRLERMFPKSSANRERARVALAAAALGCLAVAATGPVRGYTLRPVERRGLDLVVCLDTSRSMLVRDVKPDRLTRAKREIAALFGELQGDRAALVAFSGEAREVAPLTHDAATLEKLLAFVDTEDNTLGGTDLGAALERALLFFDQASSAYQAIVLVTDGEDLEGKGREQAKRAADHGVRVFVLGMGTEEGGKIPLAREDGTEGFLRDGEGKEVVSAMDVASLTAVAEATGGTFLASTQSPTPLSDLYHKRIKQLEGRVYESGEERVPHDRFQWFLALALGCMLAEFGLRERRFGAARAEGSS